MDIKIFIDYATEIVLQVLRKNSQELQKAYQENDNKKIYNVFFMHKKSHSFLVLN